MKEKMREFKLTRTQIELSIVGILVLLGLTAFTVPLKSQGTLTYQNGKITYTGTVVNHRMNGQGKLVFENGDTYEGQFDNGVFTGQGTFTSHQGWNYVGHFAKGQADGQGKLTTKAGKVFEGTFKQGIYQK